MNFLTLQPILLTGITDVGYLKFSNIRVYRFG